MLDIGGKKLLENNGFDYDAMLDVRGFRCPMPLLKTKQKLNQLVAGEVLYVKTTDPGSVRDFDVFLAQAGYCLQHQVESGGEYWFWIKK